MKIINLLAFILLILTVTNSSAQTPQAIENDLLKLFKKIDYWKQKESTDTTMAWSDSLENANGISAKKLKYYCEKFPSTIAYPFNRLVKEHIVISSSIDGLFRIYSWDTETGGTMHFFESVMQYKSSIGCKAILDTPKSEGDAGPLYNNIYTFKANGKAYYMAVWLGIGSTIDKVEGIHIFSIENGKLVDAKLIKTHSGLHSDLSYEVQGNSYDGPKIHFDNATNTIHLPLVDGNYQVTNKFILYKFTGQYFERVKN